MNKVIIGLIIFVIAVLGVGFFVVQSDDEPVANETTQTTEANESTANESETNTTQLAGEQPVATNQIKDYSQEALAMSTAENNVLFFHAAWCTVCNSVERALEAGTIPDDINVFKVDYDSPLGQDLAKQYKIPIQYAMVAVNTDGSEIGQWVNQFNAGIDAIRTNLEQI